MQNETQNQNIDSQEVKVEEAAVQTEMSQEQNIGVSADPYRGPEAEEPADIDPKVTMSSEDLVGSDPKVTMNPEDISGPQTAQEPGFDEATSDFWDAPESPENLSDSLPEEVFDWDSSSWGADDTWGGCGTFPSEDPFSWESGGSDVPDPTATIGIIADPVPADQVEPSDSEAAAPLSPEAVSMPHDKIVDPVEQPEPTLGGYDGSGIAGGLDLDGNGVFDQTENNPDNIMSDDEEEYTYDEEAYEDAEDALEELQDALQDGDEEDLAEALEELQDYLGGFGKGDEAEDQDGTKTQDNQLPSDSEDDPDGGSVGTIGDLDGDGIEDWEDDSDGDGVADWVDFDSDNDGIEDWKVLDSDGNGTEDGKEDSDGDGLYDWQDSDSNGDGIDDWSALLDLIEEDPGCFPEYDLDSLW